MTDCFLSCDWGTSTFRLHLVGPDDGAPVASVVSDDGIGAVHRSWLDQRPAGGERERFYLAVVQAQIDRLSAAVGRPLSGLPLVVSGMATATIGLRELPYRQLPFSLDGSDLNFAMLPPSSGFPHDTLLISGARVADDVMRGEETQVVGAGALAPVALNDGLVILPGTHSKHVRVRNGRATTLRTYMTGEFFDLLSRRSILANSVEHDVADAPAFVPTEFADGVRMGASENLLHASFGIRVAEIFGARSKVANRHFLSGLVIGAELAELPADTEPAITLVVAEALAGRYESALRSLGWTAPVRMVPAEQAVIAGQTIIATRAGLFKSTPGNLSCSPTN